MNESVVEALRGHILAEHLPDESPDVLTAQRRYSTPESSTPWLVEALGLAGVGGDGS